MEPKFFVLTEEDRRQILALDLVREIDYRELTLQEQLITRMMEEIRRLQEGYK